VPQLSLFESSESILADDQWGQIVYMPYFLPAPLAKASFSVLLRTVNWKAERRRMYDRDVAVPRLTAHFGIPPKARDGDPAMAAISAVSQHVITTTGVAFNSVGLNLYRDGRDSVAPHNDHLNEIVEGLPIALLSLGATRRMVVRAKAPRRRVFRLALQHGSLLVMGYATQLHYTHAIPKTTESVGERISLVFRVKPAPERSSHKRSGTEGRARYA
jgi:alkylated DNA repair dioxygenase AlkB